MSRVALVTSGLMFGGGQRVMLDLLGQSRKEEAIDAQLVLLGCSEPMLRVEAAAVVPYDGRYNRPQILWATGRRLRHVLGKMLPDILHTQGWDADVIGALAIRGSSIRQVVHLEVTPEWLNSRSLKHAVRRAITRWALRRSRTVTVAGADAVKDHWARLLPWDAKAIAVILNGIDVEQYRPSEASRPEGEAMPVVGVVARLAPEKGIEYLLDALGMLAREGIAFQLKVAGDGELRVALDAHAVRLGLADRTRFLGFVSDLPAFYHCLDIYALPSLTEGLPLGVLEAMATGLPVVSTTVGGTSEVVRDGRDGLLVPPRNAKALAAALRRLLSDEALRKRMGTSARQRATRKFSLKRFAGQVFDLYREIARNGSR